jgi:hypothetical protein
MAAWARVVVVEMKNPTGAPCSVQAQLLTRPCHQSVLTNLQHVGACPRFGALLESPLPGSLLQTMPVLRGLLEGVFIFALPVLTPDAALGLGCSPLHSRRCLHCSCCLAFSLWKVNALLAFAECYQQGSFGNYICKRSLMPLAFPPHVKHGLLKAVFAILSYQSVCTGFALFPLNSLPYFS